MAEAVGYAVLQAVVSIAVAKAVDHFQSPQLRKRWEREYEMRPQVDVQYSGALEPRRRLYGYFRASGLNTVPAITTGNVGQVLNQLLTISDGEIEGYDAIWFDNDRIPLSDIAETSTGVITGSTPYVGFAKVKCHTGLASQDADSLALGMQGWTSDHRGDGIAYIYAQFMVNLEVYKNGPPTLIAEGRGHLCYDPRLDSSPGANPTDPAFQVFTTNPPLILTDFLTWESGGNELAANINWADVVTAANICEESVTIPVIPTGTTTQERFTCSIEVFSPLTTQDRDDTIGMLARAMMGVCWYSEGQWHMRAGVYTTPAGSIIDTDFLGNFRLQTAQSRSQAAIFNTVRGSYVDQNEMTQPKSYPEVSSSTYFSEDGEVVYGEAEYPTARTVYEAERNAILKLRLSRRRIIVSATFKYRCRKFELYDVVLATVDKVGWVAQPARIIEFTENQDWTVDLTLQEIGETDFDDPDVADYINPSDVAVPLNSNYAPEAPQDLRATQFDSAILLEWDPPVNAPVGVLYQVFEYTSDTPFSSATQVGPETAQNSMTISRTTAGVRYYWVRSVDPTTRAVSTTAPPVNGLPAAPSSATTALTATVYPGSATASVGAATATTNSVTTTPTGGTPSYTYAWTWHSGGTGITIDSNTAATTTFSATGLTEGETRSGSAKCTVTDGVAVAYDVYATVTISRRFDVTLVAATYSGTGGSTTPAMSGIVVAIDGKVYPQSSTSTPSPYDWISPGASAADYDCRITAVSGTLQSNNATSWVNLGSTTATAIGIRTPGAGSGTSSQTLTVEIRDAGSLAVIASETITLQQTIP